MSLKAIRLRNCLRFDLRMPKVSGDIVSERFLDCFLTVFRYLDANKFKESFEEGQKHNATLAGEGASKGEETVKEESKEKSEDANKKVESEEKKEETKEEKKE